MAQLAQVNLAPEILPSTFWMIICQDRMPRTQFGQGFVLTIVHRFPREKKLRPRSIGLVRLGRSVRTPFSVRDYLPIMCKLHIAELTM